MRVRATESGHAPPRGMWCAATERGRGRLRPPTPRPSPSCPRSGPRAEQERAPSKNNNTSHAEHRAVPPRRQRPPLRTSPPPSIRPTPPPHDTPPYTALPPPAATPPHPTHPAPPWAHQAAGRHGVEPISGGGGGHRRPPRPRAARRVGLGCRRPWPARGGRAVWPPIHTSPQQAKEGEGGGGGGAGAPQGTRASAPCTHPPSHNSAHT